MADIPSYRDRHGIVGWIGAEDDRAMVPFDFYDELTCGVRREFRRMDSLVIELDGGRRVAVPAGNLRGEG